VFEDVTTQPFQGVWVFPGRSFFVEALGESGFIGYEGVFTGRIAWFLRLFGP
jgi:hypothetical protein